MKLRRAIASYLLDCETALDYATLYTYELALHRLEHYLLARHIRKVQKIHPDHIRRFISQVASGKFRESGDGPVSDNTTHQHYRSLITFFRWLIRERKLQRSPMENIRPPCQPHPATHYLKPDGVHRLLQACAETQNPTRDIAITVLFLDTGLRRDELASLTLEDVDLVERSVTVKLGKMHKGRVVPLSSRCCEALETWLHIRPGDLPTLFGLGGPNIYQIFYRMRKRAPDLGDISPHELRHTFGTYYDGDIKDTSLLLGHADVNTTAAIYCHRQSLELRKVHDERTPLRLLGSGSLTADGGGHDLGGGGDAAGGSPQTGDLPG